jgi:hypothetical protein
MQLTIITCTLIIGLLTIRLWVKVCAHMYGPQFKRLCAWCPSPGRHTRDDPYVTHGICSRCSKRMTRELIETSRHLKLGQDQKDVGQKW